MPPNAQQKAVSALKRYLRDCEDNPARRERLFVSFCAPRAAFISRLTQTVLAFIVEERPGLHGAAVLDYGCGVSPYRKAFERMGARVIGADIGDNRDAELQIAADGSLAADDRSFEYVFSSQVMEHVTCPQEYLREAYRLLKPGGKLFVSTHGLWPYHPTPCDLRRWTRQGLACELESAGFDVKRYRPILNEYAAAVQFFAMAGEYRGAWGWLAPLVHCMARAVIARISRTLLSSWRTTTARLLSADLRLRLLFHRSLAPSPRIRISASCAAAFSGSRFSASA